MRATLAALSELDLAAPLTPRPMLAFNPRRTLQSATTQPKSTPRWWAAPTNVMDLEIGIEGVVAVSATF
jgi:hypothetical protein